MVGLMADRLVASLADLTAAKLAELRVGLMAYYWAAMRVALRVEPRVVY
jgi:hypothetical protein